MYNEIKSLKSALQLDNIPRINSKNCDSNVKLELDNSNIGKINDEIVVYLAFVDYSTNLYPLIYVNLYNLITLGKHIDESLFIKENLNERINCTNTIPIIASQLSPKYSHTSQFLLNGREFVASKCRYPIYIFNQAKYDSLINFCSKFRNDYSNISIFVTINSNNNDSCIVNSKK